jgi:hypothetical protein
LVEKAKANVGFALITGPNDFRHGNILDIYNGGYAAQKYRAQVFDVPGMGHQVAPARVLDFALDWLERSEDQTKVKKKEDRKTLDKPASPKRKSEPAAEAKVPLPRTWADASGKFHVTAKFRGMANKVVKLELEDGSVISVPLEKLSDEDQERIRQRKY